MNIRQLATRFVYAIQLEERDLMTFHPEYAEYRRRVPMLVPRFRQKIAAAEPVRPAHANVR